MQIATLSKILEEPLFLRKPPCKSIKLPMIHANKVEIKDNPKV